MTSGHDGWFIGQCFYPHTPMVKNGMQNIANIWLYLVFSHCIETHLFVNINIVKLLLFKMLLFYIISRFCFQSILVFLGRLAII